MTINICSEYLPVIAKTAISISISCAGAYYIYQKVKSDSEGTANKRTDQTLKVEMDYFRKTGRQIRIVTTEHERQIMNEIVFPDQIKENFDDIGGLTNIKDLLYETVILPLQNPEVFDAISSLGNTGSSLIRCPRGVLFYGPPGTGKTMMAKAIAKSCQATFINLRASVIENKYYGESQKLIRAVFSLAQKVAPCIIFIDEIDMFLSPNDDHHASQSVKSELLALWDGLISPTGASQNVTILAATNRPSKLEQSIQRRLPVQLLFDLPDEKQRVMILERILARERVHPSVELKAIAARTRGYSGSDLSELCRNACMIPLREVFHAVAEKDAKDKSADAIRAGLTSGQSRTEILKAQVRPAEAKDFEAALERVKRTGQAAQSYQAASNRRDASNQMNGGTNGGLAKDQMEIVQQLLRDLPRVLAEARSDLANGDSHVNGPRSRDAVPRNPRHRVDDID